MTGHGSGNSSLIDHNGSINGILENTSKDTKILEKQSNMKSDNLTQDPLENDFDHSQLATMVFDLSFQNAYLKAQFDGLRDEISSSVECFLQENKIKNEVATGQVQGLQEKIKVLNKEIKEHKETQKAAESALEHLKVSYAEADAKAQELSAKLIEVKQMKEQEIKERDEKYVDLDTKFQRLHKRAKQRIQELQKEKDDLELRFQSLNQTAEKASSQQSALQLELEKTRQQANEALRAIDSERQQLRTTNNKLRDSIDEMHRLLETKDATLEELRHSLYEKEQMLGDTQRLLQASEERKQTSIADISTKHKNALESIEAQLADALLDIGKAAETISSLQAIVDEKDSKIAELEAASTGEAVRLKAAVEAAKTEVILLKNEKVKEKEHMDAAYQTLKSKLEASESARLRSEIEAAKSKSQFESEVSSLSQLLLTKDSELLAAKEEINHVESEFSSYKIRAHALLQKKEAELQAGKNSKVIQAQEEAIRQVEKELEQALADRDKFLHELESALLKHENEILSRNAALISAEQQNRGLVAKLESLTVQYISEKEALQRNIVDNEEKWKSKFNALESEKNLQSGHHLQSELDDLKLQYHKLKEEHETFRNIADRALEEKEKEIFKLLEENQNLIESLESGPVIHGESLNVALDKPDSSNLSIAAAEQQILLLARQQAQREEQLAQSQRHILALQDEIDELERENRLRSQQEAMLKEALREMERKQKREGVDMTYLKNVIMKLLETGEVEVLLPVISMLLQFSPEEIRKCQQAYRSASDALTSSAASSIDSPRLTARSLFSRFAFS